MADNIMEDASIEEDLTPPQADPSKDYLKELVGDKGQKFKSVDDLAKGKFESDQYIEILKRRLDEMREDYLTLKKDNETKTRLEDLVNQISERSNSSNTPQRREEQLPAFDPKQLDSLVSSKIQEHEMSRQQAENFNSVRDRLRERYGANYKARLQEQIEDLGITEQDLNEMARRQPKVLIRTLGLDRKPDTEPFQAPPTSSRRSDSFSPTSKQERTWAYYQELKKNDPKLYFDRKTAVQMQQDAIELGDKFYDGNFYVKGLHER